MTIEEIREDLNIFLTDELEIDREKIHDDARLKEDVGIDSLDYVDIVAFVSRSFGFKLDRNEMKDVLTLGQLYEYIQRNAKA